MLIHLCIPFLWNTAELNAHSFPIPPVHLGRILLLKRWERHADRLTVTRGQLGSELKLCSVELSESQAEFDSDSSQHLRLSASSFSGYFPARKDMRARRRRT